MISGEVQFQPYLRRNLWKVKYASEFVLYQGKASGLFVFLHLSVLLKGRKDVWLPLGGVPSEKVRLSIRVKQLQEPKGNPLKVLVEEHGSTKLVKEIDYIVSGQADNSACYKPSMTEFGQSVAYILCLHTQYLLTWTSLTNWPHFTYSYPCLAWDPDMSSSPNLNMPVSMRMAPRLLSKLKTPGSA